MANRLSSLDSKVDLIGYVSSFSCFLTLREDRRDVSMMLDITRISGSNCGITLDKLMA